jgi:hypothetical protein
MTSINARQLEKLSRAAGEGLHGLKMGYRRAKPGYRLHGYIGFRAICQKGRKTFTGNVHSIALLCESLRYTTLNQGLAIEKAHIQL